MIFDLQAPLSAQGGGDQNNCAVTCAIYVRDSHTKFGWIPEKNSFNPNPPCTPSSPTHGA